MRIAACLVAIALGAGAAAPAHAHGGHWRGGIGISFGFPVYVGPGYYGPWPAYPAPVVVAPPPAYAEPPAPPPVKAPPEPIFYPRQGQDAAQLEADRQACNRWATTQPSAMADASVFHRATLACMDARGYTSR
ncbi:hypothetical protein [Piscinibacter sp.]|uniref:hypothetical protein n=1 Tax=Piscinibacter sp. TaxID=1903157 RepID=UPI0011DB2E6E|nr:MAG: hypothetical protein E6Q93_19570 [Burkholderiaceae bacterium]